jgi:hypothetical protein
MVAFGKALGMTFTRWFAPGIGYCRNWRSIAGDIQFAYVPKQTQPS